MPKPTPMDADEQELIAKARLAVTSCNWSLGECAHQWTDKYSRGRTDFDFAELVGNDTQAGHVGRCRRVWATFCVAEGLETVRTRWPWLSWSHFDKARAFVEHAVEALDWAQVNDAPIRGMQAWACETWPELRSQTQQLEATEQQEAAALESMAQQQASPVDQSAPVQADDIEDGESIATREEIPEPANYSPVKPVLRALVKSIEAFRSGLFQKADPDQQSEILEQTENFRKWLTCDDATAPAQGDALILLQRLQWCSRICNAKFVSSLTESTRMLVQSAIDDLAGAIKKYRQ